MKRTLLTVLAVALCMLAASCGNQSGDKNEASGDIKKSKAEKIAKDIADEIPEGSIVGYEGDAGAALKKLNDKNYVDIVKAIFGVDIAPQTGWTLYKAYSPTQVNNVDVTYTNAGGIDSDAVKKAFFEQLQKISEDGIYVLDLDFNTFKLSKGAKLESFEDFKTKASGKTLYYVYKGQGVQGDVSTRSSETSSINYKFVLTTVN